MLDIHVICKRLLRLSFYAKYIAISVCLCDLFIQMVQGVVRWTLVACMSNFVKLISH